MDALAWTLNPESLLPSYHLSLSTISKSRSWMELPMHRLQALLIDMGVNLRSRNIGVAEHLLDNTQIGAVPEQVRGETVPKQVRINVCF